MGFLSLITARRRRHRTDGAPVADPEWREADARSTFDWENAMLSRALREAGVAEASLWELLEAGRPYPEAIPALVDLLPRVVDPEIKDGIVRALSVPEAHPLAAGTLWNEFLMAPVRTHREQQLKWAIGRALGVVCDDSTFGAVASILRNPSHGWTRTGLLCGLSRMPASRKSAVALLLHLLEDPDCAADAVLVLARFREPSARSRMRVFLDHSDPRVREEVRRALETLDSAGREEQTA